MGKTKRKDKHDKEYRESLKKKDGWYRCRCERCVGANSLIDKIAEKEMKEEIRVIEMEENIDYEQ
jgi:hypothetical protein